MLRRGETQTMTRPHTRRKVTLKDVAAQVGVSHTTVSNAYIRPGQLSVALRDKILAAAHELGYTGPDPAAKQLATGRAGALGFLFSEDMSYAFSDPAILSVLNGVATTCDERGTDLALISAGSTLRNLSTPVSLGNAAVDGYILYSVAPDSRCMMMAQQRNVPLVVVDQPRLPGVPYVGIDDRGAAYRAARTLLDLGHRSFGILSLKTAHDNYFGPLTAKRRANIASSTIAMRLEGYLAALAEDGITPEDVPTWELPKNVEEDGIRGMNALLRLAQPPTAVLAMSDCVALGAMRAIRDNGLQIPQDVSIFGFDDIPKAEGADLSTVRQPHERKGMEAAQLLHAASGSENIILPTELVLRGSVGAPS